MSRDIDGSGKRSRRGSGMILLSKVAVAVSGLAAILALLTGRLTLAYMAATAGILAALVGMDYA